VEDEYWRYSGYDVIEISPSDLINFDRIKALQDMVARNNALLDRLKASGQIIDVQGGGYHDDDLDNDEPDYLAAIRSIAEGR
jgi:hypothetical protein